LKLSREFLRDEKENQEAERARQVWADQADQGRPEVRQGRASRKEPREGKVMPYKNKAQAKAVMLNTKKTSKAHREAKRQLKNKKGK